MAIKALKLDDGTPILVEVDTIDAEVLKLLANASAYTPSDLPDDAEPTGLFDDMIVGGKMLRETIATAAQQTKDSLAHLQPDEWSVELNVGFVSDDKTLLSYLAKGNGSMKVTAKWKKSDSTTKSNIPQG